MGQSLTTFLTSIADAIRSKKNTTNKIKATDFVDEILSIETKVNNEIATEAEMTALLEVAEVGTVYKYIGESGTYENGALYIIEEGE